jgi:hypothetical protein
LSFSIDFAGKSRILDEPTGDAKRRRILLIQSDYIGVFCMSESVRGKCAWVGCVELSEAEIAERPLCSRHFYLVAQRRLSALLGLLSDDTADHTLSPDVQRFLSELVSGTETLTSQSQRLTPERLEELLKLSVKAAEVQKMMLGPT